MHQISHFELNAARVAAFQLKPGTVIRVTKGRLWLTLEGQAADVWLRTGEHWTLLGRRATVWLSAEPTAQFQLAQPVAARQGRKSVRPATMLAAQP